MTEPGQTVGPGEVVVLPAGTEAVQTTEIVQTTGVEVQESMLWHHFARTAATLSNTDFVPAPYRGKKPAIMACLAYGHELGLGPMQSLQSIDVISGKPTLKPEMMRSLIRAAGHSLTRVEANDERCVFRGKRRDTGDEETVTFSIEDARRMGLTSKDNWKKQPRAMLTARCTGEIARSLFSDVIMGASYTPEEMGDETHPVDNEEIEGDAGSPSDLSGEGTPAAGEAVNEASNRTPEGAPPVPLEVSASPARGVDRPAPSEIAPSEERPGTPLLTEAQRRGLHAALGANDLGDDARHDLVAFVTHGRTRSSTELTRDEANTLITLIGLTRTRQLEIVANGGVGFLTQRGEDWLAERGFTVQMAFSTEPF